MTFSPDGAFHRSIATQATCGEANRTRCDNGTAVGHRLKLAALGRRAGVDVILVVPRRDLQREPIDAGVARRLAEGGVKVRHADWVAPPQLSPGVPLESGGCCGAREFMKLHAFGFADYDAVAVVDNDFDVDDVERLRPIFDCAAAGHVITTRGAHSAMNGAFAAVPPSAALRDALLAALSTATVDRETGWNGAGWGPFHRKFDARMQGFIYWFFYQNFDDPRWKPVQVDPCVWNVQAFLAQMCKAEICASASVAAGHIGLMDQTRRALDCAKGGGG